MKEHHYVKLSFVMNKLSYYLLSHSSFLYFRVYDQVILVNSYHGHGLHCFILPCFFDDLYQQLDSDNLDQLELHEMVNQILVQIDLRQSVIFQHKQQKFKSSLILHDDSQIRHLFVQDCLHLFCLDLSLKQRLPHYYSFYQVMYHKD